VRRRAALAVLGIALAGCGHETVPGATNPPTTSSQEAANTAWNNWVKVNWTPYDGLVAIDLDIAISDLSAGTLDQVAAECQKVEAEAVALQEAPPPDPAPASFKMLRQAISWAAAGGAGFSDARTEPQPAVTQAYKDLHTASADLDTFRAERQREAPADF
jgi:hypothetical protein